jgi:O-antigen/teichoic acid export membrane protein
LAYFYKFGILFGLTVSIFLTTFSSQIIRLIYGADFADSSDVLEIYIWNFPLICFAAVFGKWLLAEKLQHLQPRFTLMAIVVNTAGNFILIPILSIKGAALSALASQLVPVIFYGATNKAMKSQLRNIF